MQTTLDILLTEKEIKASNIKCLLERISMLVINYGSIKIPIAGLTSTELMEIMLEYQVKVTADKNHWLISDKV